MRIRSGNQQTGGVDTLEVPADWTVTQPDSGHVSIAGGTVRTAAKYVLASDGTTVTTYDATGTVVGTPGNDFGAALTAILPAASGAGYTIALRNDGNVFPNRTLVSFPKGLTSKLVIQGNGAVVQAAVSAGRRLFDFNRTADYDTFQNIEIVDLVFDRASLTSATNESVFLGNLAGGTWSSRLNFAKITLRRCATINVPTGASINYQNVSIVGYHAASGETQTTITDVVCEDCDFTGGGNVGIALMGSGSGYTAGSGVNVFLDRIFIERLKHDTGNAASTSQDVSVQLAGVGYGGVARLRDCYSAGCGDIGYEVDAIQDFEAEGCVAVDAKTSSFLSVNFRAPIDYRSQIHRWKNCFSYKATRARSATIYSSDFALNNQDTTTAGYKFGELLIEDPICLDAATTQIDNLAGYNLSAGMGQTSGQWRKLTVRNMKIVYSALNMTAGGKTPTLCGVRTNAQAAEVDLDITFVLSGTRSTSFTASTWKMLDICNNSVAANDVVVRRSRVAFDVSGFSGITNASETFYWNGFGVSFSTILEIQEAGTTCLTAPPAGTHHGIVYGSGLTIKTGTKAFITRMDMSRANAAGNDVFFNAAAQKTATRIKEIVSQRAAANGPATVPTALTGLVTATGVAIGATLPGQFAIAEFTQGSGAGITAIDYSTDAGTTYQNALTQAAAAMPAGANLRIGPLPPDALIKVTFATTQPTINLVPTNP